MNGPGKTQIAEYWAARTPVVFDINMCQPSCFACGWWKECWAEKKEPWEASRLQRCHLGATPPTSHKPGDRVPLMYLM